MLIHLLSLSKLPPTIDLKYLISTNISINMPNYNITLALTNLISIIISMKHQNQEYKPIESSYVDNQSQSQHPRTIKAQKKIRKGPSKKQGEAVKKQNKSDQKGKTNYKQGKQEKKEGDKKQRASSGAQLGRPKKIQLAEQDFQLIQNPTLDAQQKILQYLAEIGLKHGLVFRQEDRVALMNQKQRAHDWKADHEWDPVNQRNKIMNNAQVIQSIKQFAESQSIQQELVVETFLAMSDIMADECTEDIYYLLAAILDSIRSEEYAAEAVNQRAKRLLYSNKLKFLPARFTKLKIKYWIQIINDEQLIESEFVRMFMQLKGQIRKIFETPRTMQLYIEQQNKMNEDLLKIIDQYKQKANDK